MAGPPTRRAVLAGLAALALPGRLAAATTPADPDDTIPAPPLADLIRHPILRRSLFRLSVGGDLDPDGAAGANRGAYRWIEEQRQGADWIQRGVASEKPEWIARGWQVLDWGLGRQQPDGGFASGDPFHSTSFYVEALARALILDPAAATPVRRDGLARAADWLLLPAIEKAGITRNTPYTHRRYILAAALGETAAVTGEDRFARRAAAYARDGIALQHADGTNPEKGGFDAGYQMVGVVMALRYLPACPDPSLRAALRAMIRRAIALELTRQGPDGRIDPTGSTRILLETGRTGVIKQVPDGEVVQALCYAALALPDRGLEEPAERLARARKWWK